MAQTVEAQPAGGTQQDLGQAPLASNAQYEPAEDLAQQQPPAQQFYNDASEGDADQQPMQVNQKRRAKSNRKKPTHVRHNGRGKKRAPDTRNPGSDWDDRFYVTTSNGNNRLHQFFREYFDKKPKQFASNFRVKYANQTNELPGITDVGTRTHTKVKDFKSLPEKAHQNVKKLMSETRMPLKKGQSGAFPSAKKHFKLANGWQNDFTVMQSRANENLYKGSREFFDKPIMYQTGQPMNKTSCMKPMEVYHKITPVRSIQQSINLIRALKNEQKEESQKTRPKSVAINMASCSDNYGQIPNLRDSCTSGIYLPIKTQLGKMAHSYSTVSPGSKDRPASRYTTQANNKQGITSASWEQFNHGNDNSMDKIQPNAAMAQTGGIEQATSAFNIRNTRHHKRKGRKARNNQKEPKGVVGHDEYGAQNINTQSQDTFASGNVVNARASQEQNTNPMTIDSVEKLEKPVEGDIDREEIVVEARRSQGEARETPQASK